MQGTLEKRFSRQLALTEPQQQVIASIRYQDQDQSVKGGAVLAYSGLLIATAMVQLSSSKDSVVYISNRLNVVLCLTGLFFLFASSVLSLYSLVVTRKFSPDTTTAILQFDDLVTHRRRLTRSASWLALLGSIFVLVPLLGVVSSSSP